MLQAKKLVKLEEMVGVREQEEEPEGQIIARLSREAVGPPSLGNTPFFLFRIKLSF